MVKKRVNKSYTNPNKRKSQMKNRKVIKSQPVKLKPFPSKRKKLFNESQVIIV